MNNTTTVQQVSWEKNWAIAIAGFIVLAVGVVGNSLIIILKTRARARDSADAVFKVALAVADTINLCVGMPRQIAFALTGNDTINYSYYHCVFIIYLAYNFRYISTYILIALNIERCYAVKYPMVRRSPRIAVGVCLAITVLFLLMHVWVIPSQRMIIDKKGNLECSFRRNMVAFVIIYFPWVSFVLNWLIACIIFISAHVIILKEMKKHDEQLAGKVHRGRESQHHLDKTAPQKTSQDDKSWKKTPPTIRMDSVSQRSRKSMEITSKRKDRSTLYLLFVLDISYFVLICPREVWFILKLRQFEQRYYRMVYAFLSVLGHVNNAINFFAYYAMSRSYRKEFKDFFRRKSGLGTLRLSRVGTTPGCTSGLTEKTGPSNVPKSYPCMPALQRSDDQFDSSQSPVPLSKDTPKMETGEIGNEAIPETDEKSEKENGETAQASGEGTEKVEMEKEQNDERAHDETNEHI